MAAQPNPRGATGAVRRAGGGGRGGGGGSRAAAPGGAERRVDGGRLAITPTVKKSVSGLGSLISGRW